MPKYIIRKGKLVERQGRKTTGLKPPGGSRDDSRVAG